MTCQKPLKPEALRLRVANRGWGAKRAVGGQRLARTRWCALVCLLASALAALGTADASPAQHQRPVSQHRSKAAEAEGHKHGTGCEAEQRGAAARTGGACGRAECPSAG